MEVRKQNEPKKKLFKQKLSTYSMFFTYKFQSESELYGFLNEKDSLPEAGARSEVYVTATGIKPRTT